MKYSNATEFFDSKQRLIFVLIIITGLVLRWYGLDQKPLHHDESLHYMYSVYPIDNPKDLFYKYDPMLHGPILYTLQPFVFKAFGISIATSRILPALIGSIILAVPFILRSFLCPWSVIASTTLLALSPSLVYWSRFFIHDPFVMIGFTFVLIGALIRERKNAALWVSLGLVFQFCTKANCYVTSAIFLGYLIFEALFIKLTKDNYQTSLAKKIYNYCCTYKKETCYALIFFISFYCYLFTSGFRNLGDANHGLFEAYFGAIIDAVYRKSIGYWINQNAIERIKGPFLFHFYLYSFYEIAFLFLYFTHLYLFVIRSEKIIKKSAVFSLIIYFIAAIYHFNVGVEQTKLGIFFKLKDNADLAGLFLFFFHSILLSADHLLKKQYSIGFFAYFFTANMFTYAYLGEKVPWLSQYPIYFGILYFTLYFKSLYEDQAFKSLINYNLSTLFAILGYSLITIGIIFILESHETDHVDRVLLSLGSFSLITTFFINKSSKTNLIKLIAIALCLITVRSSILTNFVYAGDPNELMSQVHTTKEFDKIMRRIRNEVESSQIGDEFAIYSSGEPVWPMTAYLQGLKGYKYIAEPEQFKFMCYMFDTRDTKTFTAPSEFEEKEVLLRGWWVPEYSEISLKKYLNYVINHKPWNSVGYSYARMYINHNPTCGSSRMKQ